MNVKVGVTVGLVLLMICLIFLGEFWLHSCELCDVSSPTRIIELEASNCRVKLEFFDFSENRTSMDFLLLAKVPPLSTEQCRCVFKTLDKNNPTFQQLQEPGWIAHREKEGFLILVEDRRHGVLNFNELIVKNQNNLCGSWNL